MTSKEAKYHLEQAYWLTRRIESKLMQRDTIRTLAEKVTPVISDMPKGGRTSSRVEEMAVKIADIESLIDLDITQLLILQKELYKEINSLPDPEAVTILEMRYLGHNTWEEIAECIHTSLRNVHNMHGRALQLFAETYSKL